MKKSTVCLIFNIYMKSSVHKNYLDVRIGTGSKYVVVLAFNSPVEVRQTSLIINNVRVPTGTELQRFSMQS